MIKFNAKYEPQKNVIVTSNKVTEPKNKKIIDASINTLVIVNGIVMNKNDALDYIKGIYA